MEAHRTACCLVFLFLSIISSLPALQTEFQRSTFFGPSPVTPDAESASLVDSWPWDNPDVAGRSRSSSHNNRKSNLFEFDSSIQESSWMREFDSACLEPMLPQEQRKVVRASWYTLPWSFCSAWREGEAGWGEDGQADTVSAASRQANYAVREQCVWGPFRVQQGQEGGKEDGEPPGFDPRCCTWRESGRSRQFWGGANDLAGSWEPWNREDVLNSTANNDNREKGSEGRSFRQMPFMRTEGGDVEGEGEDSSVGGQEVRMQGEEEEAKQAEEGGPLAFHVKRVMCSTCAPVCAVEAWVLAAQRHHPVSPGQFHSSHLDRSSGLGSVIPDPKDTGRGGNADGTVRLRGILYGPIELEASRRSPEEGHEGSLPKWGTPGAHPSAHLCLTGTTVRKGGRWRPLRSPPTTNQTILRLLLHYRPPLMSATDLLSAEAERASTQARAEGTRSGHGAPARSASAAPLPAPFGQAPVTIVEGVTGAVQMLSATTSREDSPSGTELSGTPARLHDAPGFTALRVKAARQWTARSFFTGPGGVEGTNVSGDQGAAYLVWNYPSDPEVSQAHLPKPREDVLASAWSLLLGWLIPLRFAHLHLFPRKFSLLFQVGESGMQGRASRPSWLRDGDSWGSPATSWEGVLTLSMGGLLGRSEKALSVNSDAVLSVDEALADTFRVLEVGRVGPGASGQPAGERTTASRHPEAISRTRAGSEGPPEVYPTLVPVVLGGEFRLALSGLGTNQDPAQDTQAWVSTVLEGEYNTLTGRMSLLGCWNHSQEGVTKASASNDSERALPDFPFPRCGMAASLQFPPRGTRAFQGLGAPVVGRMWALSNSNSSGGDTPPKARFELSTSDFVLKVPIREGYSSTLERFDVTWMLACSLLASFARAVVFMALIRGARRVPLVWRLLSPLSLLHLLLGRGIPLAELVLNSDWGSTSGLSEAWPPTSGLWLAALGLLEVLLLTKLFSTKLRLYQPEAVRLLSNMRQDLLDSSSAEFRIIGSKKRSDEEGEAENVDMGVEMGAVGWSEGSEDRRGMSKMGRGGLEEPLLGPSGGEMGPTGEGRGGAAEAETGSVPEVHALSSLWNRVAELISALFLPTLYLASLFITMERTERELHGAMYMSYFGREVSLSSVLWLPALGLLQVALVAYFFFVKLRLWKPDVLLVLSELMQGRLYSSPSRSLGPRAERNKPEEKNADEELERKRGGRKEQSASLVQSEGAQHGAGSRARGGGLDKPLLDSATEGGGCAGEGGGEGGKGAGEQGGSEAPSPEAQTRPWHEIAELVSLWQKAFPVVISALILALLYLVALLTSMELTGSGFLNNIWESLGLWPSSSGDPQTNAGPWWAREWPRMGRARQAEFGPNWGYQGAGPLGTSAGWSAVAWERGVIMAALLEGTFLVPQFLVALHEQSWYPSYPAFAPLVLWLCSVASTFGVLMQQQVTLGSWNTYLLCLSLLLALIFVTGRWTVQATGVIVH